MFRFFSIMILLGVQLIMAMPLAAASPETGKKEDLAIVKVIHSRSLEELTREKTAITYEPLKGPFYFAVNETGALGVGLFKDTFLAAVTELHEMLQKSIEGGIQVGQTLTLSTRAADNRGTMLMGKEGLVITCEESFRAEYSLMGSEKNIDLTAPIFVFDQTIFMVETNATITLRPPSSLKCPIQSITFTPLNKTLAAGGALDFARLTFDNFFIAPCRVVIQF